MGKRHPVWDFTCPDTQAPSHLTQTSLAMWSATQSAEEGSMLLKCASLGSGCSFYPVAIETLGYGARTHSGWCQRSKSGWQLD